MSEKIKTIEELEDELCDWCPLKESEKGVHCYGGEPVSCMDSGCCSCDYEAYLEDMQGVEDMG